MSNKIYSMPDAKNTLLILW